MVTIKMMRSQTSPKPFKRRPNPYRKPRNSNPQQQQQGQNPARENSGEQPKKKPQDFKTTRTKKTSTNQEMHERILLP